MRLLLVNPPITTLRYDVAPVLPPLGIMYIAAMARKRGHEVTIFDSVILGLKSPQEITNEETGQSVIRYGAPDDVFLSLVAELEPDVIGLSNIMAVTEKDCLDMAAAAKRAFPDVVIVIGGTNATARAEALLMHDQVDFVFRGEGDSSFIDFLDVIHSEEERRRIPGICFKLNGESTISNDIPVLHNLDENPIPAWDLVDIPRYIETPFPFSFHLREKVTTMVTSRGCVGNCLFCSGRKLLGSWRSRSPENVIQEAQMLRDKHGIQEIQFLDSNISLNKKRFTDFLNLWHDQVKLVWAPVGGLYVQSLDSEIISQMSECGCHSFPLGIEGGNEKMQKYLGKIVPVEKVAEICKVARQRGMWTHGLFVIGFPGETGEDIYDILRYAKRADLDSISMFAASPLPGSELYLEYIDDATFDPDLSRIVGNHFALASLPREQLSSLRNNISRSFFLWKLLRELSPCSIFTRIRSPQFTNMILFIGKALKRFLFLRARDH